MSGTARHVGDAHDPERLLAERAWLVGLARTLVDDVHAAEDLTQDTFVRALERAGPVRSVRAFLGRVVRNRAIDRHRSETARTDRERRRERPDRSVPPTDELVARAETQRRVAEAVQLLDEPYRTTVLLRWFEGLSPAEIAERTGTPRETVKTRLRRGHTQLRQRLDREFGGGREEWRKALLPLATLPLGPSPTLPGPPSAATLAVGGLLVSKPVKFLVAACLLALLGLAVGVVIAPPFEDAQTTSATTPTDAPVESNASETRVARTGPETPLSGRVRSRLDGRPVVDASVRATTSDGATHELRTDANGRFAWDALPAGARTIHVRGEPWMRPEEIQVEGEDAGTVWLHGATDLTVRVVDEEGAPVAGALVVARRRVDQRSIGEVDSYLLNQVVPRRTLAEERTDRTGSDGLAQFRAALLGWWVVTATDADGRLTSDQTRLHPRETSRTVELVLGTAHELSGRLTRADGRPAPEVVVSIEHGSVTRSDTTDGEGRFRLTGLPAGLLRVRASPRPGVSQHVARVRVPDVEHVELWLPATTTIHGTVRDPDGRGIAGAFVAFEVDDDVEALLSTTTGPDGGYRFDDVPCGRVMRVHASHPEWALAWPVVDGFALVFEGGRRRDTGVGNGAPFELDLGMVRGSPIQGVVRGPDGPVAGAIVTRWRLPEHRGGQDWHRTQTDADGRYRLPPQLPGEVVLEVDSPGLYQELLPDSVHSALRRDDVPARWRLDLPGDGATVEFDIDLLAGPSVSGEVVDGAGEPVGGARVWAGRGYEEGASTRTDASGSFRLERVRPRAEVRLSAEAGELETPRRSEPFEVEPGVDVEGIALVAEEPTEQEREWVQVTGLVRDAQTLEPLGGVGVHEHGQGAWFANGIVVVADPRYAAVVATTDAYGRFEARASARSKALTLERPGYLAEVVALPRTDGDSPLELRLQRPEALAGRVIDATGAPVADAWVLAVHDGTGAGGTTISFANLWLYRHRPQFGVTRTDAAGTFRLTGLRPGTYTIGTYRADATNAADGVRSGPHEAGRTDLTLSLGAPDASALRVRFVHGDGTPVQRAAVVVLLPGTRVPRRHHLRDTDGRFELTGVGASRVDLEVQELTRPGVTCLFRGVTATGEEVELVVRPGPAIEGRALDADGVPLVGARIEARVESDGPSFLGRRSARTDEDGRFVVRDAGDRKYEVRVVADIRHRGLRTIAPVTTRAGEPPIELRGTLETRLSGVVVDPTGRPLANVLLRARAHPYRSLGLWTEPTVATDEQGRFEFTGLPPDVQWKLEPAREHPAHFETPPEPHVAGSGATDVRIVLTQVE